MTTWRTPQCPVANMLRRDLLTLLEMYHPLRPPRDLYLSRRNRLDDHLLVCERCEARREEMQEWERQTA